MIRRPPISPLLPYTTLFRSHFPRAAMPRPVQQPPPPLIEPCARPYRSGHANIPPAPSLTKERIINAESPDERRARSEEHTSELQSHLNIVCRLLLEQKKDTT